MANTILLKRSGTASDVPTTGELSYGEIGINYADGLLYYKDSSNVIKTLNTQRSLVSVATTSSSPLNWNSDNYDTYILTALDTNITISADSGSPTNGKKVIFRFEDNGTPRNLTWTTGSSKAFRAIGVTLPTVTVALKTMYIGCIYNATDSRWDVIASATEA
jgi:hypothetical protein